MLDYLAATADAWLIERILKTLFAAACLVCVLVGSTQNRHRTAFVNSDSLNPAPAIVSADAGVRDLLALPQVPPPTVSPAVLALLFTLTDPVIERQEEANPSEQWTQLLLLRGAVLRWACMSGKSSAAPPAWQIV